MIEISCYCESEFVHTSTSWLEPKGSRFPVEQNGDRLGAQRFVFLPAQVKQQQHKLQKQFFTCSAWAGHPSVIHLRTSAQKLIITFSGMISREWTRQHILGKSFLQTPRLIEREWQLGPEPWLSGLDGSVTRLSLVSERYALVVWYQPHGSFPCRRYLSLYGNLCSN